MCGINGVFGAANFNGDALAPLISAMNDQIAHRGPDGLGVWVHDSKRLALGHRRLSIIDISDSGHQPMSLADGTTITFNGEIYNYKELKAQLPDHTFRSESDTELLLALYKKKGQKCLDDLIGMFAFAIWDPVKNGLFLARDRIGKKPLYYHASKEGFAFSSEIRGLLTLPWVKARVSQQAFYSFLTFGFVPPADTLFDNIKKLDSGHSLWVDQNLDVTAQRYWRPQAQVMPSSEADIIKGIQTRFERSMDLRMVSDVPVGVFLSGGVDSTAVATHMRRRTTQPLKSFSISFADQPAYDEAQTARQTAQRLGLEHHERIVEANDIRFMLEKVVDVLDEPLADATCIPLYFLSEMASQNNTKVILTGDGPDELFLGYRNWQKYIKAYPFYNRYSRMPGFIKNAGLQIGTSKFVPKRFEELLFRANRNQEFFWGKAPSFKESEKQTLLSPAFLDESQEWDAHNIIANLRETYNADFGSAQASQQERDANWMAYVGLRFNVPNFYMLRADRLGMQHGVELRAPFLDHNFVNFALSIPSHMKTKGGEPKSIFKDALKGTVPDDILYSRKKGFCVPLREWGGELMVDSILDNLDTFCDQFDFFNKDVITQQVNAFKNGNLENTNNVWTLYFTIAWMNKWMNGQHALASHGNLE